MRSDNKDSGWPANHWNSTQQLDHHSTMQMSEKGGATRSSNSSTIKLSFSNSGNHSGAGNNLSMNNQVSSSASKHDTTVEHNKRSKKKANRDRQPVNDDKPAPAVMSNLTYSLIDDDHIDDQETINVGNLIIDLESSLEKEKIENEQAHNNTITEQRSNANSTNARSPTSLSTESDASGSSFTYRQRAARRRARSPTSMSPCSSSPINSTPSSPSSSNKPNHSSNNNNNNNDIKPSHDSSASKSSGKIAKSTNKPSKDSVISNVTAAATGTSNNNGHTTTRTVFKSSSDERGELKMKITREKKTMKSEHKIAESPTHKSPTGCSSSNSGAQPAGDDSQQTNSQEDVGKSSSSISSTKECGTSTSIGTITEPECLGPCEPGTSVTLEGIVWQETDGGILVVNVTWRGKTYVGALLDCTRHDWAPPRLCDSPASDIDSKANKGVRTKRIVTRSNGIGLDEKNLLQTTGKLRNGKGRRILPANEQTSCSKKQRESTEKVSGDNVSAQNEAITPLTSASVHKESDNISMETDAQEPIETGANMMEKSGPESPMLIGCDEPNCSKKYRNSNGLQYHQSHAHSAEGNAANTQNDCTTPQENKPQNDAIEEAPSCNLRSPNDMSRASIDEREKDEPRLHQGQKRERTSSPQTPSKNDDRLNNEPMAQPTLHENKLPRNESPRISYVKRLDPERRLSSSSGHSNLQRAPDPCRGSPNPHQQRHQSLEPSHGNKPSPGSSHPMTSSASSSALPAPKSSSHSSKQSMQQQPPLPATTEEGMKPSGTSTGPPPAPHQANCYFNPAFLANTFNPYNMSPYFPRHLYDQMTPPPIPTSNAFLTRFMNNMRVPPPPDSPSRLLSPSMPKNVPFPPFKIDSTMPPQLPSSMPNMPPMSQPPLPPGPLPPMPPLSLPGGPESLRLPSQGDPLLPPSSQTPFLPPAGMNPVLGLSGMGNPLGPMGGPPLPNPVDDQLAKQFPRRFN